MRAVSNNSESHSESRALKWALPRYIPSISPLIRIAINTEAGSILVLLNLFSEIIFGAALVNALLIFSVSKF